MTRWNTRLRILLEGIGGAIIVGVTVLLAPLLRRWYSRWGTENGEERQDIPGDALVPRPKSQITLAITIQAPPEQVWPWFVQLGCQRGGWYSYDLLDNGGVPSAERIIPEHQTLNIGDTVKAMPQGDFGFPVAILQPNRQLTLAGTLNTRTGQPANPNDPQLSEYFCGNQTFVLNPVGPRATRLIFRMRIDWNATPLNNLAYKGMVEPISFVMGRKMLRNLKRRAEARNG
ncbi:MAG: hypothetical protein GYA59_03210 [Chloroflexi bacterium]|nr:hypothetical protein [Chloroflexota bacterium]